MFLHSLRLSFMQKSEKSIARFSGKTTRDRLRERETERDGPEYKGPPNAIAKPSDQKSMFLENHSNFLYAQTTI